MDRELGSNSPEVRRLKEIQQEMLVLLDEAEAIVSKSASRITAAQAVSYWIPEVRIALVKEHDYLARCMCCMDDTIEQMCKDYDEGVTGG